MAIVGGMDLGYGSQIQVVRTNYLVVGHINATATAQAYANFLALYNDIQTQAGAKELVADYILGLNDNGGSAGAEVDPSSGIDPKVLYAGSSLTNFPVRGPVDEAIADETVNTYPDAADTTAEVGRNYKILAVLNMGVMDFGASFTAGGAIDLLGGTSGNAQQMMSKLMVAQVGGDTSVLDFTEVMTDVTAAGVLGGTATLSLANAAFNASFVQKGNSTGATPTTLGSGETAVVGDTCALISVVSLIRNS